MFILEKEVVVLVSILNYFPLKMQRTIYISILPDPSAGDFSRAGHAFFSNNSCKQYGESNAVGLTKKEVYLLSRLQHSDIKLERKLLKLE